jgi:hypothetical protein
MIQDHFLIQIAQVVERVGHLKNSRTRESVSAR